VIDNAYDAIERNELWVNFIAGAAFDLKEELKTI
jgi:hypothetical protein